MAKANLRLPNGTKVQIEGPADEVATLLATFSGPATAGQSRGAKKKSKVRTVSSTRGSKPKHKGPVGLITGLAKEGYFKTRKRLPEIQKKLEEQGHIYAQTSLSPAVLGLTKKQVLRRLKEKKGWAYVRGSAVL